MIDNRPTLVRIWWIPVHRKRTKGQIPRAGATVETYWEFYLLCFRGVVLLFRSPGLQVVTYRRSPCREEVR